MIVSAVCRSTGKPSKYRAAGDDRWAPIGDVERFVVSVSEQRPAVMVAQVWPATAAAGLGAGR